MIEKICDKCKKELLPDDTIIFRRVTLRHNQWVWRFHLKCRSTKALPHLCGRSKDYTEVVEFQYVLKDGFGNRKMIRLARK